MISWKKILRWIDVYFEKRNPDAVYLLKAREYYESKTNRILNYRKPKDLNEKLLWLNRYWRNPLKSVCADKYGVREYLKNLGLGHLLVPLYGVYSSTEEIDFDKLPNEFVLKCNHGSGFNVICTDKTRLDISSVKSKISEWMATDFSLRVGEFHYRTIEHKIVCEKLISQSAPTEYQFWCINGNPESILVCRKNFDGTYDSCSMSLDGTHLKDRIGESDKCFTQLPLNIDELISYSKILSAPFPFVRVDFYEHEGQIFFAELTFTPSANVLYKYSQDFLDRMGSLLKLPKKIL